MFWLAVFVFDRVCVLYCRHASLCRVCCESCSVVASFSISGRFWVYLSFMGFVVSFILQLIGTLLGAERGVVYFGVVLFLLGFS